MCIVCTYEYEQTRNHSEWILVLDQVATISGLLNKSQSHPYLLRRYKVKQNLGAVHLSRVEVTHVPHTQKEKWAKLCNLVRG